MEQTLIDFLEDTDDDLINEAKIDSLIASHKEQIDRYKVEILKCKSRIGDLKKKKELLIYGDNTVIFKIAERLFTIYGGSDMWLKDSDWSNYPNLTSLQQHYYNLAQEYMAQVKASNISVSEGLRLCEAVYKLAKVP